MNTGTVQIMWKEIGIGLILLCLLRVILDIYMIKKYKTLVAMHGRIPAEAFRAKAQKHLKRCGLFAVGPWNKQIYAAYNGLCWLLAMDALQEGLEEVFLIWLSKVRKEEEFEAKAFTLSLYFRAKGQEKIAGQHYEMYLKSKHSDQNISVIMRGLFEGTEQAETIREAAREFFNPALIQLLKNNGIEPNQ